jgi:hypothetical protein
VETTRTSAEPEGASAQPGEIAPEPLIPEVIDRATALEVLTQAYGAVKEIEPGKRVLVRDREALWARADKVFEGRKNPFNGDQPWAKGDAEKYVPGADGFADPGTNTMYLNKQALSGTNAVHEMLHLNAAGDFDAGVGMAIAEGVTEYLAVKALLDAFIPMTGRVAYRDAVTLVTRLVNLVVGPDVLIAAYFTGADALIARYDGLKGTGAFAELRAAAERKDWTEAGMLVGSSPPSPEP